MACHKRHVVVEPNRNQLGVGHMWASRTRRDCWSARLVGGFVVHCEMKRFVVFVVSVGGRSGEAFPGGYSL